MEKHTFTTKLEALVTGKILWSWLAENPTREKKDWPGWVANGGNIGKCMADCPACEYTSANRLNGCYECLVWGGSNRDCQMTGHPTSWARWDDLAGEIESRDPDDPLYDEFMTERAAIAAAIAELHDRALRREIEGG